MVDYLSIVFFCFDIIVVKFLMIWFIFNKLFCGNKMIVMRRLGVVGVEVKRMVIRER